jgi:hypothetical protein
MFETMFNTHKIVKDKGQKTAKGTEIILPKKSGVRK